MLDISVDVNINVNRKNPRFPIRFVGINKCLHCGADNTLEKVDIFGRVAKSEVYPLDYIRCSKCGQKYSIEWRNTDDGKLMPVAVGQSVKQEFINTMKYFNIRKNADNNIY